MPWLARRRPRRRASRVGKPEENFARALMELFTCSAGAGASAQLLLLPAARARHRRRGRALLTCRHG
jgi:hypothetical protein